MENHHVIVLTMLHTSSAYAIEARLVLAQEKVTEKSNEIPAIPDLFEWLELKGNIVTIDATGYQHAITDQILKKEGNYIFSLKGEQGKLHDNVMIYLSDEQSLRELSPYEEGRGKCVLKN